MTSIEVFGLLHLAENENSAVNLQVKNFSDQMRVYASNASLLNKSLAKQGIRFTLLTNNSYKIKEYFTEYDSSINIVEIEMQISVPSGTKFYSAHYKLEVFRHISKWEGNYAIFCDLDMVCLGPLP